MLAVMTCQGTRRTVMHCLGVGTHAEEHVTRWDHSVTIIECYLNLDVD